MGRGKCLLTVDVEPLVGGGRRQKNVLIGTEGFRRGGEAVGTRLSEKEGRRQGGHEVSCESSGGKGVLENAGKDGCVGSIRARGDITPGQFHSKKNTWGQEKNANDQGNAWGPRAKDIKKKRKAKKTTDK